MKRIEEQRSRILSLFDEQSRSLRRLTLFFLLPALLFGVFIFLPFTKQVTSASRLQTYLDSTRMRLAAAADTSLRISAVDSLLGVLNLFPRLRHDLDFRLMLGSELMRNREADQATVRRWATGETDVDLRDIDWFRPLPPNQPASDCVWLDDRRWRTCFDVTLGAIPGAFCRGCVVYPDGRTYVQDPVQGRPAPQGPLDESLARELVDSLVALRRALVEDLASLAETIDGSYPIWGQGHDTAHAAVTGVQDNVDKRRREVRDRMLELEGDTTFLAAELERARNLIRVIEQSGSSFETPLGPLPVGIRELVLLYPAILGVAYFVCLTAFRRLMALRRGYDELTRMLADTDQADAMPLQLTTPLWYDPLASLWPQLGRVLVALVPLAFMLWSYLALRSGLAGLASGAESRFGQSWYDAFFLLTLLAVVFVLGRVVLTIRDYAASRRSAAAAPSTRAAG